MKSRKTVIGAAVFSTLTAFTSVPASSAELLRGLDPCIKAKEDFRAKETAIRNSLTTELTKAEQGELPDEYKQAMWGYVKNVSRAEFDQYVWPLVSTLVASSQDEAFDAWFEQRVKAEGGIVAFERAFAAKYTEMLKEEVQVVEQQVSQQKAELKDSCPNDVLNSTLRAALNSTVGVVSRNIKAGEKEKTLVSKITKGTIGISTDDIRKHGLAGGKNSEVRKAGRAIAKVFGW